MNPQAVTGQIEGGTAQGLGLALMEEIQTRDGLITNASFTDYLIPTTLDMPPVVSELIEEAEPDAPYGVKGVGEPPTVVSTAAVVAALRAATGRELTRVPVKPDESSARAVSDALNARAYGARNDGATSPVGSARLSATAPRRRPAARVRCVRPERSCSIAEPAERSISAATPRLNAMMMPIVAARPMRGDATVIPRMISTESAPPSTARRLARDVASPSSASPQEREPDHDRDDPGEGERGEDSRAPAQLSHHRRLDGARETRGHRERDGQSRHAPGAPSGIVTDSSHWNRLKVLPSVSLQRANQPTAGNRLLVLGLAAELAHLREVGVDVVAAEVDRRAGGALHLRVDGAAPAVLLEHPVVDPRHPRVLDRPAADGFPELLRAVGVLRRELDVHDLLAHLILLSG